MIKLSEIFGIYESDKELKIIKTEPYIVRVKQQEFKEFCKEFKKPYDAVYSSAMVQTMRTLCRELPGCTLGYYSHNEIDLIFVPINGNGTLSLLKGSKTISYISSVVASKAVSIFNDALQDEIKQQEYKNKNRHLEHILDTSVYKQKLLKSIFEVKAFNLPKERLYDYIYLKHLYSRRDALVYTASTFINKNDANSKSCEELIKILKEQYNYDFENNSVLSARFKNGIIYNRVVESKNTSCILIEITKPLKKNKDRKIIERMMFSNNVDACVKCQYEI